MEIKDYMKEVDEIFKDHHDCMGLCEEEIQDLLDESTFQQRKNWLQKAGYDLESIIL